MSVKKTINELKENAKELIYNYDFNDQDFVNAIYQDTQFLTWSECEKVYEKYMRIYFIYTYPDRKTWF